MPFSTYKYCAGPAAQTTVFAVPAPCCRPSAVLAPVIITVTIAIVIAITTAIAIAITITI